jgi:predicted nucleic acid-binding protein
MTIRSTTSIKGPDAVHLACASEARIDLFVTNDNRLQGKRVEGIQFIVPLTRVLI